MLSFVLVFWNEVIGDLLGLVVLFGCSMCLAALGFITVVPSAARVSLL
jgi:hypothetical protein